MKELTSQNDARTMSVCLISVIEPTNAVTCIVFEIHIWRCQSYYKPAPCKYCVAVYYSHQFDIFPIEGLQFAVVQQSTISPTGLKALRSQTWLRKIYTQEVASSD